MSMTATQFNQLITKFSGVTELKTFFENFRVGLEAWKNQKSAEVDAFVLGGERIIHGMNDIYIDGGADESVQDGTSTRPFKSGKDALLNIIQGKQNRLFFREGYDYFDDLTERLVVYLEHGTLVSFERRGITTTAPVIKNDYIVVGDATWPMWSLTANKAASVRVSGYDVGLEIENNSGEPALYYRHMVMGSYGSRVTFNWQHENITVAPDCAVCTPYVTCGEMILDLGYLALLGGGSIVPNYTIQTNFLVRGTGLSADVNTSVFDGSLPVSLVTNITNQTLLLKTV